MNVLVVQALVYLTAALVVVPVARRLGLGSVLGYLVGGLVLGPWGFGVAGESEDVLHFAELGVVMMLFLVGLELEPSRLWRLRGPVFGFGGAQVAITAGAAAGIAVLAGLPWRQAVAIGLTLAMSSTAIVLQTLTEKGLLRTEAGQRAFAVLLFQDLAIIPMLALFPFLADPSAHPATHDAAHGATAWMEGLPAWARAGATLAAVGLVIVAGRTALRPVLRAVAGTGLRELFTAAALAIVLGVSMLMTLVGLSPALGTFLAGVVLANSEYRHELESDLEPFKGLLLGLFFLAVGSSIDVGLIAAQPGLVVTLVAAVALGKAAILAGLGRVFGLPREPSVFVALALSQVGEFAFVLLSFARANGVLPGSATGPLVAATALSMALTPLAFLVHERVIQPRLAQREAEARASDVTDDHPRVIVAGYGRFGQITGRFLRATGVRTTVLDADPDLIDVLRRFGQTVHYGDPSRLDLLRAAGAAHAEVLVVAVDRHEQTLAIVETARKHFPQLAILARVRGRAEAYELHEHGVEGVYREMSESALRLGVDTLRLLGTSAHRAVRAARTFRRHDEASLVEMARIRHDQPALVASVHEQVRELERALRADAADPDLDVDLAWDMAPQAEARRRDGEDPT